MMGAWWWLILLVASSVDAASLNGERVSYDTIVVGLGASGTMAATTLARAGKNVLALEAQDRIGGRVHTVPFGDGIVEIGAEWIHGEVNSSVYELAIKNNVTIHSDLMTGEVYRSDGSKMDVNLVQDLCAYALECEKNPPETPEPLGEFIKKKVTQYITEKYPKLSKDQDFIADFFEYLDLVVNTYEGTTSWNDVTTTSTAEELDGNQVLSWYRNGYKTLFEIMLNTYNNGSGIPNLKYKLNTVVSQIKTPQDSNGKIEVICEDGSSYTADNVIVTMSVGVLKERHESLFSPPLPKVKVDAIKNIQIGVEGKIAFLFPNRWWGDVQFIGLIWRGIDKKEVQDVWLTKIAEVSHPTGASNVLTLWITGDYAKTVETLPYEEVKTKCMQLLRKFLGANLTVPEPIEMIRSTWFSNQYTRGSFSYDSVTAPLHPTARVDLARPITDAAGNPRILFAGEATEIARFGTVHGAVDSGYREAMRLLNDVKA